MALGHWLKDYIGPNSASESGGGTVEVIKIATVSGSPWSGSGGYYTMSGGANSVGENFGEAIGDRAVIALVADSVGAFTYMLSGSLNPLANQDEFKQSTSMGVYGMSPTSPSGGNVAQNFDIYAICI